LRYGDIGDCGSKINADDLLPHQQELGIDKEREPCGPQKFTQSFWRATSDRLNIHISWNPAEAI
jgi:hypothetical protein